MAFGERVKGGGSCLQNEKKNQNRQVIALGKINSKAKVLVSFCRKTKFGWAKVTSVFRHRACVELTLALW